MVFFNDWFESGLKESAHNWLNSVESVDYWVDIAGCRVELRGAVHIYVVMTH